jgi:hypothetical protein
MSHDDIFIYFRPASKRCLTPNSSFIHVTFLPCGSTIVVSQCANAQVLESDSLALVDVYNSNGGTSWTNSTDWLITPVASWYGVTTTDGRVTHLKLAANGLTGALPAGLAALDSLHVLDVSGNALTAVPNLGALTAIDSLNVASNRLQFADVVPNVAVADASYMYAPQDSIDSPVNLVVLRGSTFNGSVTVEAGLDNAYQWRRNGESLSGQDEPALQLTCVTPANSGSYTCAITNAAAPLLTLHRRAINLTVNNFTVNAGPIRASVRMVSSWRPLFRPSDRAHGRW